MADVFRVPGSWDGLYPETSYKCQTSGNSVSKHPTSSSSSLFSGNSESIFSSDNHSLYRNFITMAKGKNNNNGANGKGQNKNVKKGEPIIVRLDGETSGSNGYQFPFEVTNTWTGFQECLLDAYPEFQKYIAKGQLMIIDKQKEYAFIPQHFDKFVHPGQELIVKFHQPSSRQQRMYQLQQQHYAQQQQWPQEEQQYYHSSGHSDMEDEYPSDDGEYLSIQGKKEKVVKRSSKYKDPSSGVLRIMNWLTE